MFLCSQWLVLSLNSKELAYISVEKILQKSHLFNVALQKEDFACVCSM